MIQTVRWCLSAGTLSLSALLLTSCGGDEPTTSIDVTASFSLCHQGTCHGLPAAGADVTFLDGAGRQVRTDTLDDAGHVMRHLDPGTYTVEVSLPDLGLTVSNEDAPIVLTEGMSFSAIMYFPEVLSVEQP